MLFLQLGDDSVKLNDRRVHYLRSAEFGEL
jgi:hypothetical protein